MASAGSPAKIAISEFQPSQAVASDIVSGRIARNAAWLLCSEGLTKGLFFAANILLARLLSAADYGILTLAQSWILYAWIVADMGIMMYGQAEAARRAPGAETGALLWEIIPLRAVFGPLAFAIVLFALHFLNISGMLRTALICAGLYLIGQAISTEWLFRGKERFDVVMLANAAGALAFLAGVVLIGSGPGAAVADAAVWSCSAFVMAAVYLPFVTRAAGSPGKSAFAPGKCLDHLRESSFFALSNVISESYRVLPFFLLGAFASKRELGLFAAPLRLVINLASLGFLIPMAFYPASASLFRTNPGLFAQSRKNLVLTMLLLGAPAALIGTQLAGPLIKLVFGAGYAQSALVFALLVWKLPLYYVRYVYGTTILATGFQRLHVLASSGAALVALAAGYPLVLHWGGEGAALSLILSELCMTAGMIAISSIVHHDSALPSVSTLFRLVLAMLATWISGRCSKDIGLLPCVLVMSAVYIGSLNIFGVADCVAVAQRLLSGGASGVGTGGAA